MPLSYEFVPLARVEFSDAVEYYTARGALVGTRFVDEVEVAVRKICDFPNAWPKVRGGMRRCAVDGYPYWLLYSHTAEQATIVVVCHSSRRPEYWHQRVKRRRGDS